MDFLIGKEITGLSTDFLWSDVLQRVVKVPIQNLSKDLLRLTPSVCEDLSKLYLVNLPTFPSKKYLQTYTKLALSKDSIPWALCMPKESFVEEVKQLLNELDDDLE